MLEFRAPVNLSVTVRLVTIVNFTSIPNFRYIAKLNLNGTIQFQEDDGNTALCMACANGQAETARVLLNHGANLDYQNMVHTGLL